MRYVIPVLLALSFTTWPLGGAQDPPKSNPPDELKKALEVYRKFPRPKWGFHTLKRIQERKNNRPVLTPEETEFVTKIELWVAADQHRKFQECLQLIEHLGADKIEEREAAEKKILGYGDLAVSALERAARGSDSEVAGRAERILALLRFRKITPPVLKKIFPGLPDKLALGGDAPWFETYLAAGSFEDGKRKYPEVGKRELEFLLPRALRTARSLEDRKALASVAENYDLDAAAPAITHWLTSESDLLETIAYNTLRRLGAAEAIPELTVLTRHSKTDVRRTAAAVLGFIHFPESIPPLRSLLNDNDEGVVKITIRACGRLGPLAREAAPLIRPYLSDPRKDLRKAAVLAMESIRDKGAVQDLIRLLPDPHEGYRAARVLGVMEAKEAVPALLLLFNRNPEAAWNEGGALARMGVGEIVPDLHEFLKSPRASSRRRGVSLLRLVSNEKTEAAILPLLKDSDSIVRIAAAEWLAEKGQSVGVSLLLAEGRKPSFYWKDLVLDDWSGLNAINALHNPDAWARIKGARLQEGRARPLDEVISEMAEKISMVIEWPQQDFGDPVKPWSGWRDFSYRKSPTLLEFLNDFLYGSPFGTYAFVVEGNRIRVLERRQALNYWIEWWEKRREK